MPTGLGNGVAVPHARLNGVAAPLIAVGLSQPGINFDAPDGLPAQIVLLLITPAGDGQAQLEVLSEVAKELQNPDVRKSASEAKNFNEFVAALRAH
jgi:mannitol/fructose-specific phosphotransferase system IIA component (Ntr-type)